MGYNTRYELESDDGQTDFHVTALREITKYAYLFYDECKWHEHQKQMIEYSKKNPSVQFKLSGEGDESGDVWVKWFKAGKMQTWKLVINAPTSPPEPW
jgi:hypothetical protein